MSIITPDLPPLAMGDKLSLDDFLSRWEAMPELKRAELIRGVVYMPSPVSIEHGRVEENVTMWLGTYRIHTPGADGAGNATTILGENSPQPDKLLRLLPEAGGRTWVHRKLLHGAPEFLTEVCASSASYDLHQKKDVYEEYQVGEYLAVLIYEQEIRWHRWENGAFHIVPSDSDGIWRSAMFPGLWLDGKALLAGDLAKVLAVLQDGLNSSEHAEFVEQLKNRMSERNGE